MTHDKKNLPDLWICGDACVERFSSANHPNPGDPLWRWQPEDQETFNEEACEQFSLVAEVKPATLESGEKVVLVCSSLGGIAIIERSSRQVLFFGQCHNAHSMEVLPGGFIAVAGSTGTDHVQMWRIADGPGAAAPIATIPFQHAHGLVWEAATERLWVCGGDQLQTLKIETDGTPGFRLEDKITLPDISAHDLSPDLHSGGLIVSTKHGAWKIDMESLGVTPFAPLANIPKLKSISIEKESGVIAFQKAEGGHWWSENVYVLLPDGSLQMRTLTGRRLYKVRWDQACSW